MVTWVLLACSVVVAAVGVVESARNRDGDLAALFVALLLLSVVHVARMRSGRPSVTLRADLVRWLGERSQLTGEPLDRVGDRAVATYRASLGEEEGRP